MKIKCRCCLNSKKGTYYSLLSVFPDLGRNGSSVLDVLRVVTSTKVTFSEDLPNEICQGCLRNLKTAFGFIVVFKNSQIFLQKPVELRHTQEENEENLETIIITGEESEKHFKDVPEQERIVIVNEDFEIVEDNLEILEEIFGEDCSVVEDVKSNSSESPDETNFNASSDDEEKNVIILPFVDVNTLDETNEVKEEHSIKNESMEDQKASLYDIKDEKEYFKKELLEMEKNRERNMSNITVMTIDDVLKVEKRKVSEKKLVLSVDDVVNAQKKKPLRRDQAAGVFICDVCKRVFHTRRNMLLHKYRLHNPNWKEKFKCTVCGTECKTFSIFRHHMLKHNDKKYTCHLCGKEYVVKQHLVVHIRNKHDNSFQNKHLCSLCGKSFKSSSALGYHLRIHSDQRNYMCGYCGFKSLALSAMKRHERVHTGERPYICRLCGKDFAGSAERQKHENIHKGIMPYKCQYCEKRFVQPYNMKVHMLQHGGDYVCTLCHKSYVDEVILKFHYQRTHKVTFEEQEQENVEDESE